MTLETLAPASLDELSNVIRSAKGPLAVCGNRTRTQFGQAAIHLSSRNLSGILRYEPSALTLVAQAGTPMAEIESALTERHQMLAFEPPDHRALTGQMGSPTLGGAIGLNASGPRRFMAGGARDFVIGAKLVDGRGDLIASGGRVMKNVTGYDLARLFCGARGRLGMMTEVALKVLPKPEATATLAFTDEDPGAAIRRMAIALRSPFEVSGAAWSKGRAYLRVEGFAPSVRYRAAEIQRLLPGATQIDEDPWPALRDAIDLAAQPGPLWRIVLRPTQASVLATRLALRGALLTVDWGGALLWVAPPPDMDIIAETRELDGHASCMRGAPTVTSRQDDHAQRLGTEICRAFDPRGLFRCAH